MPRGRPRKTTPKIAEGLQPEIEDVEPPQRPHVVEVKHKTEWSELRPVEEAPDQETLFEDEEIEAAKPRRKPSSERDDLRKKLARSNITPGSQLKLTIEKYLHSEIIDSQGGMFAEKEHCQKYVCAEDHITSEDYLDVARRYGPGLYRFTLRMKNQIVTAWDKRISAGTAPMIQHANPSDPSSPQVIFQMPEGAGGQSPVGVMDPWKQMREFAKTYKEMKTAFEPDTQAQPAAQAPTDPKIAALQLIAENPDVMERIGKGIASTVLGAKGGGDSEPWADVAMEAIKSGQAAQIVATIIREIMAPFRNMGVNNGQAPMGAPQMAPVASQNNGRPQAPPVYPHAEDAQGVREVQASMGGDHQAAPSQGASTEDQALALVIDHCRRNVPVKVAFNRLINLADQIEEQFPAGSIYDYIEMFGKMPVEAALEFVNTLPGGKQVTALAHCKEWTAELQRLITESQQEGEE